MEKVFCSKCTHCAIFGSSGGPVDGNRYSSDCHHPSNIVEDVGPDSWYTPGVRQRMYRKLARELNANNDCPNFELKVTRKRGGVIRWLRGE